MNQLVYDKQEQRAVEAVQELVEALAEAGIDESHVVMAQDHLHEMLDLHFPNWAHDGEHSIVGAEDGEAQVNHFLYRREDDGACVIVVVTAEAAKVEVVGLSLVRGVTKEKQVDATAFEV